MCKNKYQTISEMRIKTNFLIPKFVLCSGTYATFITKNFSPQYKKIYNFRYMCITVHLAKLPKNNNLKNVPQNSDNVKFKLNEFKLQRKTLDKANQGLSEKRRKSYTHMCVFFTFPSQQKDLPLTSAGSCLNRSHYLYKYIMSQVCNYVSPR